MKVTTFEGIIENGQIRLPANVRLPEKTKVYVVVPDVETRQLAYVGSPRLAHPEQAKDFQKQVIKVKRSPLDVASIKLDVSTEEIIEFIREGRERE